VLLSLVLMFVAVVFFSSQPGNGIVLVCGLLSSQDCCDLYRFALVDDSKTFTLQPGPSGTTQLVTIGNINFEVLSVLTVQFTVDDDRGPSYSTYYNVVVRDINESPTDITLSMPVTRTITLNVDETATIGTLVGTFSSKDPDTWQSFSYKLLNNGAAPPPFYVDQPVPFGTAQLRTNQTLDYDATPQYSVSCHFSVCVTIPLLLHSKTLSGKSARCRVKLIVGEDVIIVWRCGGAGGMLMQVVNNLMPFVAPGPYNVTYQCFFGVSCACRSLCKLLITVSSIALCHILRRWILS
jgi:hypothetical protein